MQLSKNASPTAESHPIMRVMDFTRVKTEIEGLLQQGQPRAAAEKFRALKKVTLPRARAAEMADLARRVGLPDLAIRFLGPIIYPKVRLDVPATEREIALYAAALARLGALSEAIRLLENLPSPRQKESLLHLSYAHIYCWNYSAAMPLLQQLLTVEGLSDYERTVAQLNLAAAYRFTCNDQREVAIVQQVLKAARENGWGMLNYGALELYAQSEFFADRLGQAEALLQEALAYAHSKGIEAFNARKWMSLVRLRARGQSDAEMANWSELRIEAKTSRRWEAVREIDYFTALLNRDSKLLWQVYAGTPFASYRQRIVQAADWAGEVPAEHSWEIYGRNDGHTLDLSTLKFDGRETSEPTKLLRRLLWVLSLDFYRPMQTATIFSMLHPRENFQLNAAPSRIRVLLSRLRSWLSENEIPLSVVSQDGATRLRADKSMRIVLPMNRTHLVQEDETAVYSALLETVRSQWQHKAFTARQVLTATGEDRQSVDQALKWGRESGVISVIGEKRGRMYRFEDAA